MSNKQWWEIVLFGPTGSTYGRIGVVPEDCKSNLELALSGLSKAERQRVVLRPQGDRTRDGMVSVGEWLADVYRPAAPVSIPDHRDIPAPDYRQGLLPVD